MKKLKLSAMLLFAAMLMFSACGGGGGGSDDPDNPGSDETISISVINGVTPPACGETPVSVIAENEQFTGTVVWSTLDATFVNKIYTATITLTAKSGYTLTGVTADFFTVAGTSTAATNSADSGVVTAVFPQADWATYNLRDTGPAGGLIFYINPNAATDGWKYLECAPQSTEWIAQWGKYGTLVGGTGTAVGTGKNNTALIVAKLNKAPADSDRAAQLADALMYGTYSDWFLPSKDELNLMYANLKVHGVGGFDLSYYRSSSEFNAFVAWVQGFTNGFQNYFDKYSTVGRVRAVRAF